MVYYLRGVCPAAFAGVARDELVTNNALVPTLAARAGEGSSGVDGRVLTTPCSLIA